MCRANFLPLFADQRATGLLLVETPPERVRTAVVASVEDALAEFGADAMSTAERLAEFHRVENTYLSTFQTLGGLGLLLGTVGLAAVLLRNVAGAAPGAGAARRRRLPARPLLHDGAGGEHVAAGGRPRRPARPRAPGLAPAVAERGGGGRSRRWRLLLLFAVFVAGCCLDRRGARRTRAPLRHRCDRSELENGCMCESGVWRPASPCDAGESARRRELAAVARAGAERHQRRKGSAGPLVGRPRTSPGSWRCRIVPARRRSSGAIGSSSTSPRAAVCYSGASIGHGRRALEAAARRRQRAQRKQNMSSPSPVTDGRRSGR